jgi:hypothetical protein
MDFLAWFQALGEANGRNPSMTRKLNRLNPENSEYLSILNLISIFMAIRRAVPMLGGRLTVHSGMPAWWQRQNPPPASWVRGEPSAPWLRNATKTVAASA